MGKAGPHQRRETTLWTRHLSYEGMEDFAIRIATLFEPRSPPGPTSRIDGPTSRFQPFSCQEMNSQQNRRPFARATRPRWPRFHLGTLGKPRVGARALLSPRSSARQPRSRTTWHVRPRPNFLACRDGFATTFQSIIASANTYCQSPTFKSAKTPVFASKLGSTATGIQDTSDIIPP